jgi:hypothetical protein
VRARQTFEKKRKASQKQLLARKFERMEKRETLTMKSEKYFRPTLHQKRKYKDFSGIFEKNETFAQSHFNFSKSN